MGVVWSGKSSGQLLKWELHRGICVVVCSFGGCMSVVDTVRKDEYYYVFIT